MRTASGDIAVLAVSLDNRNGTTLKVPPIPHSHAIRCAMSAMPSRSSWRTQPRRHSMRPKSSTCNTTYSASQRHRSEGSGRSGAPLVWPEAEHNVGFDWEIGDQARRGRLGRRRRGARDADLEVRTTGSCSQSMEPRGALGRIRSAARTFWTCGAIDAGRVRFSADLLAERCFRIRKPHPGRDPGCRRRFRDEAVSLSRARPDLLRAAKKLGRPVKWASIARSEALRQPTRRGATTSQLDLALDEQGRFLALSVELPRTWAPICPISRRKSRPPRRGQVWRRLCLSGDPCRRSRASTRIRCRSTPIAAPDGPRRPTRSSG